MPFDSSLIGLSSIPQVFEVTREAVERFMQATEDVALQRSSSISLEYAPPTFPTTFRLRIPGLELDGSKMQLIHGEQLYEYTRRLRIGEQVTCIARVVDVRERAGRTGSMTFVKLETTALDNEQKPVFTAQSTVIVRLK